MVWAGHVKPTKIGSVITNALLVWNLGIIDETMPINKTLSQHSCNKHYLSKFYILYYVRWFLKKDNFTFLKSFPWRLASKTATQITNKHSTTFPSMLTFLYQCWDWSPKTLLTLCDVTWGHGSENIRFKTFLNHHNEIYYTNFI